MVGQRQILWQIFRTSLHSVRVKWWSKSPPRLERSGRQGKPRAVQGQIGGEG